MTNEHKIQKLPRLLSKIYWIGAIGTGSVIAFGNLTATAIITYHTIRHTDSMLVYLGVFVTHTGISLCKSAVYGIIWPIFIPYAIAKPYIYKPRYTYRGINKNGLIGHFIPGWSIWFKD